jgi:ATP-binding cassette, subfamily F, member 3
MIAINDLCYYLGGRTLYENASLHIKPKDKIGLIGLNGTGKSTLLRLIHGDLQADGGQISKSNDCSIGFLNQDLLSYQTDESILSVAMQAFGDTREIQHKMDQIIRQMEVEYQDKLVEQLSKLQEQFEMLGGYSMKAKAEEVLEGIGFKTHELEKPLKQFSGGWRMRVMLAKLLLEQPSLLMLDEPTNHLDLPSIQWVENYIRNYEGAVIIVSHDRHFLNSTVNMIVEVSGCQLHSYSGDYDFYQQEKKQRAEIQQNTYENQQQKIKETERFIERFRAKATKAKQVQSRVKALERMDTVEAVDEENAAVNFGFSFSQHSGRQVVTLDQVRKAFGDKVVLKEATGIIERGDKIALIGANGTGKSTLLRIIAGQDRQIEGEAKAGHNVNMTFYAQHQLEALRVENEILEELKQAGTQKTEQELRSVLGCFLFQDEEVFKKIKVLSGGEKSRVALAKVLISQANFLILDEPTNHLDMQSVSILAQAIQQYEGTALIVSHDRHFISQTATKIWYIEDQQLKEYPGTYGEFEYWKSQQSQKVTECAQEQEQQADTDKEKRKAQHQERKELQNRLKKLQRELEKTEEQISALEDKRKELEEELSKPEVYSNVEVMMQTNEALEKVKQQLEKAHEGWEELALEIEELEEQLL